MRDLGVGGARGRRAVVALIMFFGLLVPSGALAAATHRIGKRPAVPAGSQTVGPLAASTRLHLTVTLQPRDPAALAAYASAVSTPGSSVYHQFLSVGQFAQRFGPTSSQIAAARQSLAGQGLTPGAMSPNHLSFSVTAPAGQVASAMNTNFERYRLPSGRVAYANTSAPQVAGNGANVIQGVLGLNNLVVLHPQSLYRRGNAVAPQARSTRISSSLSAVSPCSLAGSTGAYTADQIASAYGFNGLYSTGDQGAGVTIALFELEPYSSSDIGTYKSCYGTSTPISNVTVGSTDCGTGVNTDKYCGLEDVLDIEDVIGLAPQATLKVYEGQNDNTGVGSYNTYNQIITDNTAKVISTSWGLCESAVGPAYAIAENALFQEAAVQGQSVFAASGDSGADGCADGSGQAVNDPAAQPFVTSVGGTRLGAVGPPPVESVWNDGSGAGGGGISEFWSTPSYQSGFAPSHREVPDLSADADPNTGYAVYWTPTSGGTGWPSNNWGGIGGTSAAAPTVASLAALAEDVPRCTFGFANPALYSAARSNYAANFNDITAGNNGLDGVSGFSAGTGYDMASGLGSPKGLAMAATLCHDTITFTSVLGTQHATVGRPITTVGSAAHSSLNKPPITYSAAGLPPGISINSSTGVISGTPTTPGLYTVSLRAVDQWAAAGTARFQMAVAGLPRATAGKLKIKSGILRSLSLNVFAGSLAPAVKTVQLVPPSGAHFSGSAAKLRKEVGAFSATNRRLPISVRLSGGRLQVTFQAAVTRAQLRISRPALKLSRALAKGLSHRSRSLKLAVLLTDTAGAQTRAQATFR